jgi:hypothetical protein
MIVTKIMIAEAFFRMTDREGLVKEVDLAMMMYGII